MKLAARISIVLAMLAVAFGAGAQVLAADGSVDIAGKAFSPSTITISAGDTVTWTVVESINEPHSVTSGTPADSGKLFDSGTSREDGSFTLRDDGASFEHTFDEPGEFTYYCVVHPVDMTGKVVVLAEGASAPPSVGPAPGHEETGVPATSRLTAGIILVIAIVLMFGIAMVWRRMNPA